MSPGIVSDGGKGPVLTSYGFGYGMLYGGIFLLFLAIVVVGFLHEDAWEASLIASGLLWVLYSAYPIPRDKK